MTICQTLRIPPWELDRLTVAQLHDAIALVEEIKAEAEKAK